jgi:hypothetical protein
MIAISPVKKAEIPEAKPRSIVSAKAGLLAISANIVPPAGTDAYNEFVKDVPMKNNSGIVRISPNDHLPNLVLGITLPRIVYPIILTFQRNLIFKYSDNFFISYYIKRYSYAK